MDKALVEEIYDPSKDASPIIRGYYYQILLMAIRWLELDKGSRLYIEFSEDLAELVGDFKKLKTEQHKHRVGKISLNNSDLKNFILNSFELWVKLKGKSEHIFITTAEKTKVKTSRYKEKGIDLINKWSSLNSRKRNSLISLIKKISPPKRKKKWQNFLKSMEKDQWSFFSSIKIKTSHPDAEATKNKLCKILSTKFPESDPEEIFSKLVAYLLDLSSKDKLKELNAEKLKKVIISKKKDSKLIKYFEKSFQDINIQLDKIRKEFTDSNRKVLKKLDNRDYSNNIDELVAKCRKLGDEGECITVIKILKQYEDKLSSSSISEEVKFKFFRLIAKSYNLLGLNPEASRYYLKSSDFDKESIESLYSKGLGYYYSGEDYTSELKEITKKIRTREPNNKRSYQLVLLTDTKIKIDKYVEDLPSHIIDDKIALLISYKYNLESKYDKAIWWAKKANKIKSKPDYKLHIVVYYLQKYLGSVSPADKPIPSKFLLKKLSAFHKTLTTYWESIKKKDIAIARTNILRWIAYIEFLQGKDTYQDTIEEACIISKGSVDDFLTKAQFLLAEEKKEEAKTLLERYSESSASVLLKYEMELRESKSISEVEKVIVKAQKEAFLEPEYFTKIVEIALRISILRFRGEVKNIIKKYENQVDELFIKICKILIKPAKEERRKELKQVTQLVIKSKNKFILDFILSALLSENCYEDACSVIKELKLDNLFTRYDSLYLQILEKSGNDSALLKSVRDFIKRFGNIPELKMCEIRLITEVGDEKSVLKLVNNLLKSEPDNLELLIQQKILLLSKGKKIKPDKLLNIYKEGENYPLSYGIEISRILAQGGYKEESLDFSYNLRRKYSKEWIVHQNYIGIMLTYFKNTPSGWLNIKKVSNNSAVTITGENGTSKEYILDDRHDVIWDKELNLKGFLYKRLIGKSIGDEITVGKIQSIKHKYVSALQESFELKEKHFPKDKSLIKFKIKTGKKPDFSAIETFLRDREISRKKTIEIYNKNQLPIAIFNRYVYGGFINTWGNCVYENQIGIRCALGTEDERTQAITVIQQSQKEKSGCVLDYVTILTIDLLNIQELVVKFFNKVYISKSIESDIKNDIAQMEIFNVGTSRILGMEEGKMRLYEYDKNYNQVRLQKLKNLLEWIQKNTSISTTEKILEIEREKRKKYSNFIGSYTFETILLAADKTLPLFSDELAIRSLALNEYKVEGFWIQPLLIQMLSEGYITREEYLRHLNKLVFANYRYISIELENLTSYLIENQNKIDKNFTKLLNIVTLSDQESLVRIISVFFKWVVLYVPIPSQCNSILVHVLDILYKRADFSTLLKRLKNVVRRKLILAPLNLRILEDTINSWLSTKLIR